MILNDNNFFFNLETKNLISLMPDGLFKVILKTLILLGVQTKILKSRNFHCHFEIHCQKLSLNRILKIETQV